MAAALLVTATVNAVSVARDGLELHLFVLGGSFLDHDGQTAEYQDSFETPNYVSTHLSVSQRSDSLFAGVGLLLAMRCRSNLEMCGSGSCQEIRSSHALSGNGNTSAH